MVGRLLRWDTGGVISEVTGIVNHDFSLSIISSIAHEKECSENTNLVHTVAPTNVSNKTRGRRRRSYQIVFSPEPETETAGPVSVFSLAARSK